MVRKCNNDIPQTYYEGETQNADNNTTAVKVTQSVLSPSERLFLHTGYGYLRFYPGIENLIKPMLSYQGCHLRATYIGCTELTHMIVT